MAEDEISLYEVLDKLRKLSKELNIKFEIIEVTSRIVKVKTEVWLGVLRDFIKALPSSWDIDSIKIQERVDLDDWEDLPLQYDSDDEVGYKIVEVYPRSFIIELLI